MGGKFVQQTSSVGMNPSPAGAQDRPDHRALGLAEGARRDLGPQVRLRGGRPDQAGRRMVSSLAGPSLAIGRGAWDRLLDITSIVR